jgi:hypothetical protein
MHYEVLGYHLVATGALNHGKDLRAFLSRNSANTDLRAFLSRNSANT